MKNHRIAKELVQVPLKIKQGLCNEIKEGLAHYFIFMEGELLSFQIPCSKSYKLGILWDILMAKIRRLQGRND